jgi:hypothetical protein
MPVRIQLDRKRASNKSSFKYEGDYPITIMRVRPKLMTVIDNEKKFGTYSENFRRSLVVFFLPFLACQSTGIDVISTYTGSAETDKMN